MSTTAESATAPATPLPAERNELVAAAVRRPLRTGAMVCFVYAAVSAIVNGPVLDELIVPGQIIAGLVTYPAGHPHEIFSREAFSLLDYVAAALLLVFRDATVVSVLFNVLFLFVSTFAPFALAFVLARRMDWAFVAAALTAAEVAVRLDGLYPLFVFPAYFTNGHVGTYLAVLVIALTLGRAWASAGFLLGILPSIHAAMAMVVWPWALLYVAFSAKPSREERARLLRWFAAGFAVCVVLGVIVLLQAQLTRVAAPYDVSADGGTVYESFSAHTDTHRRLFRPVSFGYLVNPLAFLCMAALPLWLHRARAGAAAIAHKWLLGFGITLWGYVYVAWLIQRAGSSLPAILDILMPFRYANLTAIMLVPLTVSALAHISTMLSDARRRVAIVLVALLMLGGAMAAVLDRPLVQRNLLMVLWAASFAFALFGEGTTANKRALAGAAFLLLCASLVPFMSESRVAVYTLATFVICVAAVMWAGPLLRAVPATAATRYALPIVAVLLAAAALPGRRSDANPDAAYMRISEFDRTLETWLRTNANHSDMILPAVSPWTALQPKTGQPVLFQWETLYLMTYMPQLAPTIGAMAYDLYGVRYGDEQHLSAVCGGRMNQWCSEWLSAWKARRVSEWRALADKYDFRLVLAPTDTPLSLPAALQGPKWTLYRIP